MAAHFAGKPEEVAKGGYESLMKGEARALPTLTAQMQAAAPLRPMQFWMPKCANK